MARALTLGPGVADTIRSHGHETYPHECCGALLGANATVSAAVPLPNTTEEGPRRRFLVRPGDYQQAERAAADAGCELLGFYHSHPDHPAQPSQYDLDHAWPSFSYVIISVMAGQPGDLRSWTLKEDRSAFDVESLTVQSSIVNLQSAM